MEVCRPVCRLERSPAEEGPAMATNLHLDDRLVERARVLGKHRTKREAVTEALLEYVRYREQLKILDLVGTIDFDPEYDYKAERMRDLRRIPKDPAP